ncbi:MAG: tyrosine-type recombinase/integrase [Methanotrichaceae archaeon]|jgi:integrase/recombinase XerD
MDQVSNAQLIADFKADLVLQDWSHSIVEGYPLFVAIFSDFIAPDSLLAVNQGHLARYLTHLRAKDLKPASLQKYFTGLSSFFEFLMYDERYKGQIDNNPVLPFRKHYFKSKKGKHNNTSERRQCISVDQAKELIARVLDVKEKTILLLLFDTGMRLHELSDLDITDVNIADRSIEIKETPKRSYNTVFFKEEVVPILKRWLVRREKDNRKKSPALFINRFGDRLGAAAIARIVKKHATACGLHDPNSDRNHLQDRFTTHCTRHAFNTWLRRAKMEREYIQVLRGDKRRDAVDIYDHIERDELKVVYDAKMPRLL